MRPRHIVLRLTAIAGTAVIARADDATSVVLAQLRPDGIVVPFARFSETQWTAVRRMDPVRREDESFWFAVRDGRVDTLRGGEWFDTISDPDGEQDASFRGQITDFCPRDVSGIGRQNVSVVVSDHHGSTAFNVVDEGAEAWRRVMEHVVPEFERQESLQVANSTAREPGSDVLWWGHPVAAKARRKFPTNATIARAVMPNGTILFHAMLSREYPAQPRDEGCPGYTVLNAWLLDVSGQLTVTGNRLMIDNCDQKGITAETPMIALSFDGQVFVVVDEVGYEWGAYQILQWRGNGLQRVHEYAYHCL
jgi:hypothetical protein